MSIEIQCNGCGASLRVGSQDAGKQARCPKCGTIQRIPAPGENVPETTAGSPQPQLPPLRRPDIDQWYLRTPDGREYGPVSQQELDHWVGESRVSAECRLRRPNESWAPATVRYPNLPSAQPHAYQAAYRQGELISARPENAYAEAHRGGLVLTFGLLGLLMTCPLFSIAAWVMGAKDLAKMKAGVMDPSGKDMTRIGYILGIFWSLIVIAVMLGAMLVLIAVNS